jgi:hypothetical protein
LPCSVFDFFLKYFQEKFKLSFIVNYSLKFKESPPSSIFIESISLLYSFSKYFFISGINFDRFFSILFLTRPLASILKSLFITILSSLFSRNPFIFILPPKNPASKSLSVYIFPSLKFKFNFSIFVLLSNLDLIISLRESAEIFSLFSTTSVEFCVSG